MLNAPDFRALTADLACISGRFCRTGRRALRSFCLEAIISVLSRLSYVVSRLMKSPRWDVVGGAKSRVLLFPLSSLAYQLNRFNFGSWVGEGAP